MAKTLHIPKKSCCTCHFLRIKIAHMTHGAAAGMPENMGDHVVPAEARAQFADLPADADNEAFRRIFIQVCPRGPAMCYQNHWECVPKQWPDDLVALMVKDRRADDCHAPYEEDTTCPALVRRMDKEAMLAEVRTGARRFNIGIWVAVGALLANLAWSIWAHYHPFVPPAP